MITLSPYWWQAQPIVNEGLPKIDIGGIYKLDTTSVSTTTDSLNYGICPCAYKKLPTESLVLLTIKDEVPENGTTLNAFLTTSTSSTTKLPIVDSQNNNVTGANIQGNTQRFVYINKATGIVRFVEFTNK